jgi:hypothetical protein
VSRHLRVPSSPPAGRLPSLELISFQLHPTSTTTPSNPCTPHRLSVATPQGKLMGNIASSNARSGRHHEHQATAEPHKADMTRRRGRAARRDRRYELQWDSPPAADATGTAYGRLSSVLYNDDNEDFCEIPASAFKAAKPRGKGPANRQPTTKAAPATNSFNFNDEAQHNPWGRRAAPEREPDRQHKPEPEHTRDSYIPQSTREQFDDIAVNRHRAAQWMTGV